MKRVSLMSLLYNMIAYQLATKSGNKQSTKEKKKKRERKSKWHSHSVFLIIQVPFFFFVCFFMEVMKIFYRNKIYTYIYILYTFYITIIFLYFVELLCCSNVGLAKTRLRTDRIETV